MTGIKIRSKHGFSLVEDVCATAILVTAVLALMAALGFSRLSILNNNLRDVRDAEAQNISDSLITELAASKSDSLPSDTALDTAVGATRMGTDTSQLAFSSGQEKQYVYSAVNSGGVVKGYDITVRVYYNGGKNYVQLSAYASNTEGAFA